MTEKINTVINNLKEPGTTEQGGGQTNIRELQKTMKDAGQNVMIDGKFGPNTFGAMKNYLKVGASEQVDPTETNDPNETQTGDPESAERQVLSSKQEAINLLSDANLVLPGKGQIKSYLESEDGIRYVQLSLLPAYKGKIDGKFGPKTLDALKTYISLYGTGGDDDTFMKNLSRPKDIVNIGNTPWLKPEEKYIALKNGDHRYMINFHNGAEAEGKVEWGASGVIKKLKLKYKESNGKVHYLSMYNSPKMIFTYNEESDRARDYSGKQATATNTEDIQRKQWGALLQKIDKFE